MTLGKIFAKELEMETAATRKCIERVPENLYEYKPHEKSMKMGYIVFMLAGIPYWISHMLEQGDIDFGTFKQDMPKTTTEMVALFDKSVAHTKEILESTPDEAMTEIFNLKNNGQVLASSTKEDSISSTLNHLVHHRGQLTVYMRMNDIAVPSIYGPSADDPNF